MGSPKSLLFIGSETFLERLVRVFSGVCSQVLVVLGHEAERIQKACPISVDVAVNEAYHLGQLSSLRCGLGRVNPGSGAVMYAPVDYPLISSSTVRELAARYAPGDSFVIPRYEGRRGHPVLFSAALIPEFLALPPDRTARDVVHSHVATTRYIDVPDPGILNDVDYPHEYERLVRSAG
jgi:CTP:molybdopterin cytidylyltransferase MocA